VKRFLWLIALLTTGVCAEDRDRRYDDRPIDFSLYFSHHAFDLDTAGTKIDTSADRVGVTYRERYGARLQLGLLGGYTVLTQDNNPATSGRELNGYHAGFSLDLDLLQGERVDSFMSARWLYQKVDHDDGSQRVTIVTREPSFRIGAGLALGYGVRAYGGLRYTRIDGEQRLSGTLNDTSVFEATRKAGGFAGVELRLEGNGYVGVATESGTDRNVAIYFGRRF
jgi:hypothetical protein